MAFCITFGTQEFTSQLKNAPPNLQARCNNCGNWSARPMTRWPWFTICFIPLIPLSTHKYEELACPVCNFHQDLRDRPDVQQMIQNGGQPGGYGPPPGGPNQGWGQQGQQGQQQGGYPMQNYGGQAEGGGGQKPQYA